MESLKNSIEIIEYVYRKASGFKSISILSKKNPNIDMPLNSIKPSYVYSHFQLSEPFGISALGDFLGKVNPLKIYKIKIVTNELSESRNDCPISLPSYQVIYISENNISRLDRNSNCFLDKKVRDQIIEYNRELARHKMSIDLSIRVQETLKGNSF